jgi:hypothetical protein
VCGCVQVAGQTRHAVVEQGHKLDGVRDEAGRLRTKLQRADTLVGSVIDSLSPAVSQSVR